MSMFLAVNDSGIVSPPHGQLINGTVCKNVSIKHLKILLITVIGYIFKLSTAKILHAQTG